jgi:hypothetical protein
LPLEGTSYGNKTYSILFCKELMLGPRTFKDNVIYIKKS